MKIAKGYIESVNNVGLYTISPDGRRTQRGAWIEGVKVLGLSDSISVGKIIGRYCLYISLNVNETYLLGVFVRDEDLQADSVELEDGEQMLWAGEDRIFYTSPNGDMGVYTAKKNEDGTIDKDPILNYRKENESISMRVDNFALSMLGAASRGNLLMEQDANGNFVYVFEGKTRLDDKNVRFRLRISNPVLPISTDNVNIPMPDSILELTVDTTPSPIKGPLPIEKEVNPITVKIGPHRSGLKGISITYGELCELMIGNDFGSHLFSVKTLQGSELLLDSLGNISAKAKNGNKIELKLDGKIVVNSPSGVSISILANGKVSLTSQEVKIISPDIKLTGKVKLNTLPGQPGFCKQIACPMTGAPLTTSEAGN